jgi:hypothetical protein
LVDKVTFEFDPFRRAGIKAPKENKDIILEEIAEFVIEEALSQIGSGRTTVKGGNWKKGLSKGYKSVKAEESSVSFANLELTGDMLDALDAEPVGNKIKYGIEGDQADKADGNNRGSYGKTRGSSKKAREFIPKKGQTFRKEFWDGIKTIVKRHENG